MGEHGVLGGDTQCAVGGGRTTGYGWQGWYAAAPGRQSARAQQELPTLEMEPQRDTEL